MFALRCVMVVLAMMAIMLVGCPCGPDPVESLDATPAYVTAGEGSGGPAPVENGGRLGIEIPVSPNANYNAAMAPVNEGADTTALRRANAVT